VSRSLPQASSTTLPARPAPALARALRDQRTTVARGLLDSSLSMDRWRLRRDTLAGNPQELLDLEFHAFVDYLDRYFATGDASFCDLYIGEKLKQLFDPATETTCGTDIRDEVLRDDREVYRRFAAQLDLPADRERLLATVDALHAVVAGRADRRLRVLFVGDCLFLDLAAFLAAPLLAEGVAIDPAFATSKAPGELRGRLRELGGQRFDLVFFSPFSYDFNAEYTRALHWKGAPGGRHGALRAVEAALVQVQATADLVAELFDCPIYIHNAANVVLEDCAAKRVAKHALTREVRRIAADRVDRWLRDYVAGVNARSFVHLFALDERALVGRYGEHALGAYFYHSPLQHPARLGQALAETYVDILCTHAHLVGRKVIACDLDNTLWDGVIGEGAVTPLPDRQRALLALKDKGVVLSISSKNDPANVSWAGNLLGAQDFVHAEISWQPKAAGVGRTADFLNLKTRDFVFLDDRRDERELMSAAHPGIHVVDATSARMWRRFDLWAQALEGAAATDRTRMYAERAQRQAFVRTETGAGDGADQALFAQLGLEVTLRDAQAGDLARVTELLNRTNQFNLLGTRTTAGEVDGWHRASTCRILLADARDRFGAMGVVGILVARDDGERVEIVAFVLSCRVFGYGIERALLNRVKRLAKSGRRALHGRYVPTGRNQPCADVYPRNGFLRQGDVWSWQDAVIAPDDGWLKVADATRGGDLAQSAREPACAL